MSSDQIPDNEIYPWERDGLPYKRTKGPVKESLKAYRAFCDYRDMGPYRRSIRRLLDRYVNANHDEVPTKKWGTISEWSSTFRWVERSQAWDNYMDEIRTQTILDKQRELIQTDIRDWERMMKEWSGLFDRIPLHRQTRSEKIKPRKEGEPEREVITLELNVHDYETLIRMRERITKQGRLAVGLPQEIQETRLGNPDGTPIKSIQTIEVRLSDSKEPEAISGQSRKTSGTSE